MKDELKELQEKIGAAYSVMPVEQLYKINRDLTDLQAQNDELMAKLADIKEKWELASADIYSLFEVQPMNQDDGSYGIDGQSCHELYLAINKTPSPIPSRHSR